jgi:hypothetical protein
VCGDCEPLIGVVLDGQRGGRLVVDPARCGGCGEGVPADTRVCEYADGTRVHSDLACLIAWNERWHAAEGHEYEAEFYRRLLFGGNLSGVDCRRR